MCALRLVWMCGVHQQTNTKWNVYVSAAEIRSIKCVSQSVCIRSGHGCNERQHNQRENHFCPYEHVRITRTNLKTYETLKYEKK